MFSTHSGSLLVDYSVMTLHASSSSYAICYNKGLCMFDVCFHVIVLHEPTLYDQPYARRATELPLDIHIKELVHYLVEHTFTGPPLKLIPTQMCTLLGHSGL